LYYNNETIKEKYCFNKIDCWKTKYANWDTYWNIRSFIL